MCHIVWFPYLLREVCLRFLHRNQSPQREAPIPGSASPTQRAGEAYFSSSLSQNLATRARYRPQEFYNLYDEQAAFVSGTRKIPGGFREPPLSCGGVRNHY